jgi:hypothetical protein
MKNKIILIIALSLIATVTKAQYVLIPDSNFRHALISKGYASCFDITQTMLDTTCSAVLDSTELFVYNDNIISIEGVQYFKHLLSLDCSFNNIDSLPNLPSTLTDLECIINNITVLPSLPDSLTILDCLGNYIRSIPLLPNTLISLGCAGNPIYVLPNLPASLRSLSCGGDSLHVIPTLPDSLVSLDCENNLLTVLPILPSTIQTLSCNNNNLDSLPVLPDSLALLDCAFDLLSQLPALPGNLRQLYCNNNYLSELPVLPNKINTLECNNNQLTLIPNLPHRLYTFNCSVNTQLSCLPPIDSIRNLYFDSTAITCLPDTLRGNVYITPANIPICNATPCTYINGINNISAIDANLIVYPNPTTDKLLCECDFKSYDVALSDMTGRQLPLSILDNGIDISALPAGIYCLRMQNSNSSITKKFVKE